MPGLRLRTYLTRKFFTIAVGLVVVSPSAHGACVDLLKPRPNQSIVSRMIDSAYWYREATRSLGTLHAQFALFPKARHLAQNLGFSEADFPQANGLDQILAFYARVGRELNHRGLTPFVFLREEAKTNRKLMIYLDELQATMDSAGGDLVWQEDEVEASARNINGRVALITSLLTDPHHLARLVLTLAHELAHDVFSMDLETRDQDVSEFVRRHTPDFLKSEVTARRAERLAKSRLEQAGLRVPKDAVSRLTQRVWQAEDRGATPDELIAIITPEYERDATEVLVMVWGHLYLHKDLDQLIEIARLESEALASTRLEALLKSSFCFNRLKAEERLKYLTYLQNELRARDLAKPRLMENLNRRAHNVGDLP